MPAPAGPRPTSPRSRSSPARSPPLTSTPPPPMHKARTPPGGWRRGPAAPPSSSGPTVGPPRWRRSLPVRRPPTPSSPAREAETMPDTTPASDDVAGGAPPQEPAPMRASDADRHATVHVLQDAVARGLLTTDEGGERMAVAYAARHLDDLPALTADLPPAPEAAEAPAAPGWPPLAAQGDVDDRDLTGDRRRDPMAVGDLGHPTPDLVPVRPGEELTVEPDGERQRRQGGGFP